MHKASISKRHQRAEYWIRSAIELAGTLLKHRFTMLGTLELPELKVYERVSGELLSRTIWKFSEAQGKFRGNAFWSRKALDHYDEVERMGDKLFRHEHVFPQKILIEMLRKLENPEISELRMIYEKYAVAAVILKEENDALHRSGRGQTTVEGGFDNPWLRYRMNQKQILIVENELIPAWHLKHLRAAGILTPRDDDTPPGESILTNRVNRQKVVVGTTAHRYYDGPFPAPETRLQFLVTENPKVFGTASWARFDTYFKAKPKTVHEFMTAGGQAKDIRYDLWHSFIALEPDPRTAISEASMKSQSGTQPAFCFSTDGYIVKGTSVSDKSELLLKDWLGASDKQTIGDIGTFGGSPCVFINLENDLEAVLNGDTKRNAVERYVEDAQGRGEDTSWLVISNRRGRLNKLTFREDGLDTPGWYCYLRHPLSKRRKV